MDEKTSELHYVELKKDMIDQQAVYDINELLPQLSTHPPEEGIRADWLEQVFDAGTHVFAAFDGETIIGTVLLCPMVIFMGKKFWIEDVVTDEDYRGRGIAERLMEMAIQVAKEEGAKNINLTSKAAREAAHRLYLKLGFVIRDDTVVFRKGL